VHNQPPFFETPARGAGGQAEGGRKRGGENNTNAAPFAPLLLFRSMLLLFRPNYFSCITAINNTLSPIEEIRRMEEYEREREREREKERERKRE